jgi:hypothetical protein
MRRGADPAVVYSVALSENCEWLAVASHKGTVHIFSLAEPVHVNSKVATELVQDNAADSGTRMNPTSIFSIVKVRYPVDICILQRFLPEN